MGYLGISFSEKTIPLFNFMIIRNITDLYIFLGKNSLC
jgi:hypothetical protein